MIKVKVDTSLFESGMIRMVNSARQGTLAGMKEAMEKFKDDALHKPPACPRDTGWMADHHVASTKVLGMNVVQGELAVVNTPYAASLHEGISRWGTPYTYKTPGTGMKWIESKALMYREAYVDGVSRSFLKAIAALKFIHRR